ncbi:MAG TPA: hypothetical protein VK694_01830 [Verrucomicrobiae bacterium]|nr:hypothetical protein [Verrucomicrobiae bacterium]
MEFGQPPNKPEKRDHLISMRLDKGEAKVFRYSCRSLLSSLEQDSDDYDACQAIVDTSPGALEVYLSEDNHALFVYGLARYARDVMTYIESAMLHDLAFDPQMTVRYQQANRMAQQIAEEGEVALFRQTIPMSPEDIL